MTELNRKAMLAAAAAVLLQCSVALADQWTSPVTPKSMNTSNVSGQLTAQMMTVEPPVNPASCSVTDGYETTDPVIASSTQASFLSAFALGHQIAFYVSSSTCLNGRPLVLSLWIM